MAKRPEFRPEQLVGGAWKPVTRRGQPVVCGTQVAATSALQRVAYISFQRASNARHADEATVRVVDEYGAVVWPKVLRGYA